MTGTDSSTDAEFYHCNIILYNIYIAITEKVVKTIKKIYGLILF